MIPNSLVLSVRSMVTNRAGETLFSDTIVMGSAIQSISPKATGLGSEIYLLNGQVITVSDTFESLAGQARGLAQVAELDETRAEREAQMLVPPTADEILADLRKQKANSDRRSAERNELDAEVRRRAAEEGIELEEPEPSEPDLAEVIDFPGPADDILDDNTLDYDPDGDL